MLTTAIMLVACESRTGDQPPGQPLSSASRASQLGPTATGLPPQLGRGPNPITRPCAATSVRFTQLLKARDDSCKTAADCSCFPGGLPASPCGGVTSKKSARTLAALARSYRRHKCKSLECPAQECVPRCVTGRCTR